MTPPVSRPLSPVTWLLSPVAWLNLILLTGLAGAFTVLLWPQWLHNPDLSHGLFMPVICLVLLHEARAAGPARFLPTGPGATAVLVVALALGLAALCVAGLYAAAIEWAHPLVGLSLAVSLMWLMLAAAIAFDSGGARLMPLNWSLLLAAGLWVLCAPLPPGLYSRLTLGLQLWVSENVLRVLHLLGISAFRQGNIIELANASVGIEEACSGVRSLVSCIFAGLFLSGCLVRRTWHRVLIIALAAPLALGMNFLRALTLTLLTNAGVNVSGRIHDLTGFSVLAITAVLLGLLALALEKRERRGSQKTGDRSQEKETGTRQRGHEASSLAPPSAASTSALLSPDSRLLTPSPSSAPQALLAIGLTLAVGLTVLFAVNTASSPISTAATPNLEAMLPTAAPGWQVKTAGDLNRFSAALQTDHFVQRTYLRPTPQGMLQVTVYIAYWAPGQASVSAVSTHTPDACWPGAGWVAVDVPSTHEAVAVAGRDLPAAEHRLFQQADGFPQHVWFWHLYNRKPVDFLDPHSPRNLLEIAWRYGFRRAGDQMFVRLSSNRPWSGFSREPFIAEIFRQLQPMGL